ncbi:O-antigen ligase family protein [Mediterraneibacter faecis]|uniref:O-antigen ligase family protein n=1 Tax=Mediterraneibacter faecis TaxID=592978 RepID=UPI003F996847
MQTVLMAGWLALTLFLIYKVTEDKGKIFVILILYYFITVVNDIFFMSTIELANAFGFSYQLSDMLAIVMLGTVLVDLLKNPYLKNNLTNLFLLLISALLVVSMMNGLSRYGFSAEWIGDLRTNSVFLFSIFYFARFDVFQDAKKYRRLLDSVMIIILAISCVLWALDILIGFHPLPSQYNATLSDGGSTMRFIQSYEVLGIALYALLLLEENMNTEGYLKFRTILFTAAVVLFQHRSVWMAWGCGFIVILLISMKNARITKKLFFQLLLLTVFCFIVLNMGSGQLSENISKSFELIGKMMKGESIEHTTADTRTQVWNAVIEDLSGSALLIGRPYGYGYGRSIGWKTSPHSGFIRFIGRTGCIGAGLAVCLLTFIIVKLIRKGNTRFLPYVICVIGFIYGYDYTWLCGVIIGMGCMLVCRNCGFWESEV